MRIILSFSILLNFIKVKNYQIKYYYQVKKGIGKSTLAYHIINHILSIDEDNSYDLINFKINPDNKSFKLILNKSNPNFILIDIDDDKKSIDINQIRNLILTLKQILF
jgi:DNA polymerase-3 subunit delta'